MITFVCTHRPLAPEARQGLDMLMMAVSLEQNVSSLFTGDGIWQLVKPEQGPDPLKKVEMLVDLFDFESFYTTEETLSSAGLSPQHLRAPITVLDVAAVDALLNSASQHVIRF